MRGEADSRIYVLSRAEYGQQPGGGIVYTDDVSLQVFCASHD